VSSDAFLATWDAVVGVGSGRIRESSDATNRELSISAFGDVAKRGRNCSCASSTAGCREEQYETDDPSRVGDSFRIPPM
jgi:hypothetical protein